MRRVLVDHARRRRAGKRAPGLTVLSLEQAGELADHEGVAILKLDQALNDLARLDPRQARVVELRYFGGLSVEETAQTLELSPATVKREWATARAWITRQLGRGRPVA
jgi:RNA polymerase sigma factor (TIGR02999 family)